jgi:hypothetical protein
LWIAWHSQVVVVVRVVVVEVRVEVVEERVEAVATVVEAGRHLEGVVIIQLLIRDLDDT